MPDNTKLDNETDALFISLRAWAKERGVGLLLLVEEPGEEGDFLLHGEYSDDNPLISRIAAETRAAADIYGGEVTDLGRLN